MKKKTERLPDFLCVGAQKSGTSLLYRLLNQHPEIYLAKGKEIHFFNRDENYNKGIEWYSEHFAGSEDYKRVGEVTPDYNYVPTVPGRIYKTLGKDIKLIFMLRNPVDRAYSNYWMSFRRGHERFSFEKAIIHEWSRLEKGEYEKKQFAYLNRGFYGKQIERYLEYFPKENIKIFIFEEFSENIEKNLKDLMVFLGCSTDFNFKIFEEKVHPGELNLPQYRRAAFANRSFNWSDIPKLLLNKKVDYLPLKVETRLFLRELYREDINKLESLLGRNDISDIWFPDIG